MTCSHCGGTSESLINIDSYVEEETKEKINYCMHTGHDTLNSIFPSVLKFSKKFTDPIIWVQYAIDNMETSEEYCLELRFLVNKACHDLGIK